MFFVHVNASNQLKRLLLSAIELIYTVHSQSLLFYLVILELQQFILQLQQVLVCKQEFEFCQNQQLPAFNNSNISFYKTR